MTSANAEVNAARHALKRARREHRWAVEFLRLAKEGWDTRLITSREKRANKWTQELAAREARYEHLTGAPAPVTFPDRGDIRAAQIAKRVAARDARNERAVVRCQVQAQRRSAEASRKARALYAASVKLDRSLARFNAKSPVDNELIMAWVRGEDACILAQYDARMRALDVFDERDLLPLLASS